MEIRSAAAGALGPFGVESSGVSGGRGNLAGRYRCFSFASGLYCGHRVTSGHFTDRAARKFWVNPRANPRANPRVNPRVNRASVSRMPAVGRIAAGLAIALAAALVFFFLPTDELILRFGSVINTQNVSGETRISLWRDTRKLIAAYPVTGSGLGTYESALLRFKTVAPMNTADYAHNDYLQAAAELGIAAAAAGLVWVLLIFARAARAALSPDTGPNRYLALGLTGALTAILIHSLVDFNLYIPANAMVFAWICGIAASGALRGRPSAAASAAVRVVRLNRQPV